MSVDAFGVPDSFFGTHDERFFGALGRVAALSALIEYQMLTILQTMTNAPQDAYTRFGPDRLIGRARNALDSAPDEDSKSILLDYFADVGEALRMRNDYIHSLWPAQSGNQLFGWRPSRDKKAAINEPNRMLHTSLEDLEAFIATLVELIWRRVRVYIAAQALQQIALRSGLTS